MIFATIWWLLSHRSSVVLRELSSNLLRTMNCCRGRFEDKSWLFQALVTLEGSVDTAQVNIGLSCLPNQSDTYVYMSTTWRKNIEYLQIWSIYMIMYFLGSPWLTISFLQLVNDCLVTGWGKDAFSATFFNSQLKKVLITQTSASKCQPRFRLKILTSI